jgi:hypothetical protein
MENAKRFALFILMIPHALVGGAFYAFLAHKFFGNREPWVTLFMLCGLGLSIGVIGRFVGASNGVLVAVYIGAGLLFVTLRLFFGRGSGVETFFVAHWSAVLLLVVMPSFIQAREKAKRIQEMRREQSRQRAVSMNVS